MSKVPNPVVHALVAWFSHSSNWTLLGGVVLGIVTALVPHWTGMEQLQAIGNQLALLIPLVCTVIAAAQKYADGKSQGETSAYYQHKRLEERAAAERVEDEIAGTVDIAEPDGEK